MLPNFKSAKKITIVPQWILLLSIIIITTKIIVNECCYLFGWWNTRYVADSSNLIAIFIVHYSKAIVYGTTILKCKQHIFFINYYNQITPPCSN